MTTNDEPPSRPHPLRRGSTGWIYGAVGVFLWDLLSEEDEQLTGAFRRGFRSRRFLVGVSWLYLTGHLFGIIPDQYDIIHISNSHYQKRGIVANYIFRKLLAARNTETVEA